MDADQLGTLHGIAKGVSVDENAQAMGAIAEVGPGGHYLGCEHTQNNFKDAFWRSDLLDYKPFETWSDEGARDTLADYQQPHLDPSIDEALKAYIRQKKDSMPDAFRCQTPLSDRSAGHAARDQAAFGHQCDKQFDVVRYAVACVTGPADFLQLLFLGKEALDDTG